MKYVYCPVNGIISLEEVEHRIIATRTLRRLQHIRQLEFVSYVFPSCNHTRFEHTLGVTHLLKRIVENQQFIDKFLKPILWKDKINLDSWLYVSEDTKYKFIKHLLSLCGLLHDIGHGPYSHFSETMFELLGLPDPKLPKEPAFELHDNTSVKLHEWIMFSIITFPAVPCETKYNEVELRIQQSFGTNAIARDGEAREEVNDVLKKWCRFLERRYNDIAPCIREVATLLSLPGKEDDYLKFRRLIAYSACGKVPGIDSLIYGVFDVDRLDYLRRDSFMAGVKYGDIELNRLLGPGFTYDAGENNKNEMLIDYAKGIAALEHMYIGKDLLYFTTIYHPCSATARNMLLKLVLELPDAKRIQDTENSTKKMRLLLSYITEIYSMEDFDFICYLKEWTAKLKASKQLTNSYLSKLINRELYKKVAVFHWNDIHPKIREQITKTFQDGYPKLWKLAEDFEDKIGEQVLRIAGKRNFTDGKAVIINLPPYTEKWPDIRKAWVKRKSVYNSLSFYRANEMSPLLDVSPKTSDRNNIISVYLNPLLKTSFDKNKEKILPIINNTFGCHLSDVIQKGPA